MQKIFKKLAASGLAIGLALTYGGLSPRLSQLVHAFDFDDPNAHDIIYGHVTTRDVDPPFLKGPDQTGICYLKEVETDGSGNPLPWHRAFRPYNHFFGYHLNDKREVDLNVHIQVMDTEPAEGKVTYRITFFPLGGNFITGSQSGKIQGVYALSSARTGFALSKNLMLDGDVKICARKYIINPEDEEGPPKELQPWAGTFDTLNDRVTAALTEKSLNQKIQADDAGPFAEIVYTGDHNNRDIHQIVFNDDGLRVARWEREDFVDIDGEGKNKGPGAFSNAPLHISKVPFASHKELDTNPNDPKTLGNDFKRDDFGYGMYTITTSSTTHFSDIRPVIQYEFTTKPVPDFDSSDLSFNGVMPILANFDNGRFMYLGRLYGQYPTENAYRFIPVRIEETFEGPDKTAEGKIPAHKIIIDGKTTAGNTIRTEPTYHQEIASLATGTVKLDGSSPRYSNLVVRELMQYDLAKQVKVEDYFGTDGNGTASGGNVDISVEQIPGYEKPELLLAYYEDQPGTNHKIPVFKFVHRKKALAPDPTPAPTPAKPLQLTQVAGTTSFANLGATMTPLRNYVENHDLKIADIDARFDKLTLLSSALPTYQSTTTLSQIDPKNIPASEQGPSLVMEKDAEGHWTLPAEYNDQIELAQAEENGATSLTLHFKEAALTKCLGDDFASSFNEKVLFAKAETKAPATPTDPATHAAAANSTGAATNGVTPKLRTLALANTATPPANGTNDPKAEAETLAANNVSYSEALAYDIDQKAPTLTDTKSAGEYHGNLQASLTLTSIEPAHSDLEISNQAISFKLQKEGQNQTVKAELIAADGTRTPLDLAKAGLEITPSTKTTATGIETSLTVTFKRTGEDDLKVRELIAAGGNWQAQSSEAGAKNLSPVTNLEQHVFADYLTADHEHAIEPLFKAAISKYLEAHPEHEVLSAEAYQAAVKEVAELFQAELKAQAYQKVSEPTVSVVKGTEKDNPEVLRVGPFNDASYNDFDPKTDADFMKHFDKQATPSTKETQPEKVVTPTTTARRYLPGLIGPNDKTVFITKGETTKLRNIQPIAKTGELATSSLSLLALIPLVVAVVSLKRKH